MKTHLLYNPKMSNSSLLDKGVIKRILNAYKAYTHLTIREVCEIMGVSYQTFLRYAKEFNVLQDYAKIKAERSRESEKKHSKELKKNPCREEGRLIQFIIIQENLEELRAIERFENLTDGDIMRRVVQEVIFQEKKRLGCLTPYFNN